MSGDKGDYEVGYGKPPIGSRFKKGQSGNKKGRPKGSKNFSAYLDVVLNSPVTVIEDGRPKTVSAQEAALLRLREKAMKGDIRPLVHFLELAEQRSQEQEGQSAERKHTRAEDDILERFEQGLLAQAGIESVAADHDEAEENE